MASHSKGLEFVWRCPIMGNNFSLCNFCFALLAAQGSPYKWNQSWYPVSCMYKDSIEKMAAVSSRILLFMLALMGVSVLKCKIQKNWCTVTMAPTIDHHGGHSWTPVTRGETRCPGGVSVSCLASRTRHECSRHNESVYMEAWHWKMCK